MPFTVFHSKTATTPDITSGASSGEIRPSDWNQAHVGSLSLANSEVVKYVVAGTSTISSGSLQFQNANNVTFGMNFGIITASINALTSQSVQTQGIQSISTGGNSVGGGQVVFSNANGLAFGLAGSTVTGSYTVPTQTAQSMGLYASSQTTGASSSSTVDARSISIVGAGGVSVGLTNGSVVISGATGGGGGGDGFNRLAAGTQTAASATTVNFANSNGISFGMSGSAQITASHNALTSQSAQAISAANGSSAFQTLSFGDTNGLSFSVSNGSIVGSFDQTNQTVGFYAVSNTTQGSSGTFDARTLSIRGAGIASVGMSNGSVVISVPAGGGGGDGGNVLAAGTETATTLGTVLFSNSNGVSFGMSGQTRITASVAAQTLGIYAVSNSTQGSSGTVDARTLSIQGAGIASVGFSNGSLVVSVPAGGGVGDGGDVIIAGTQTATTLGSVSFADSHGISFGLSGSTRLTASHNGLTSQSAQALSAANGSFAFQTANFSNANGVSFGTSAGSAITASVAAQTAQTIGLYASSNTTGQSSSSTADARSLSIRGMGNISVGLSGGEFVISGSGGGGGGVNLSAGANSISDALVVFSNANGISFALNGSTITASHNGLTSQSNQAVSAANGSYAFQTLSFSNANGVSFGTSAGSAITASHNGLTTAALSNHSHGNPTLALTNLTGTTASASNGFTLSLSAAAATAGTAATVYGVGNSTVNSSGTIAMSALSMRGYGVLSVGTSNGSILLSTPDAVEFTQLSVGFSTNGNTAGDTALVTGRMVMVGGANITLSGSSNGGSVTVSVIGGGGGGGGVAMSAGTQSASSGTIVFSNSNNLSFGLSGSTRVTMSGALNLYGLGNTTQNSSTVLGLAAVSLNGLGALTVGYSNGSVQISAPPVSSLSATGAVSLSVNGSTVSIGVPNLSIYASSQTTGQSSSSSVALGSLSIRGMGGISVGMSGGELILSGGAGGGGGGVAISGGTQLATSGTIVFSNSNGVSFGLSGSTRLTAEVQIDVFANGNTTGQSSSSTRSAQSLLFNGAGIVSVGHSLGSGLIISASQSAQSLGIYALGNTTQSSSGTLDARSLSFNGLGAMSVGFTNGSVQLSAPATSSLSATGAVSISVNGSTISIGVPNAASRSFMHGFDNAQTTGVGVGNGSLFVQPIFNIVGNALLSRVDQLVSLNVSSSTNSSHAGALSFYVGFYTRNGSSLSLASSGSQSFQWTNTSNNSVNSLTGLRRFSVPVNVTAVGGADYWIGLMSRSATTNANWFTATNARVTVNTNPVAGLIGEVTNNSRQMALGLGMYSTTSAGLPSSIAFSEIRGAVVSSQYALPVLFQAANFTA